MAFAIVFVVIGTKKSPSEIKIGWIGPLSGDVAFYGQAIKNATDLAVDEINNAGGIDGRKIKILYEDAQMDPKAGVAALTKLANIEKVPIVIQAAGSSVMLAEAPIAEKNKVVLISPTASNDKIKYAGDYIFRNWPSDSYQGEVIADFAANTLRKKEAYILFINNDYGFGLKDVFSKQFTGLGGMIVGSDSYDEGATDFRSQLSKVKVSAKGIVFLASHYREAGLLLKQAKELGMKVQLIASDGCFAPEFIELSHGAAEGTIVANMRWHPESKDPIVSSFVAKYRNRFGKDPEVYAASSYDLIKIITIAIERGGITSDGIKNALYGIKDFPGVTGSTSFDNYGEVRKDYEMFIIKDSKYIFYTGQ